MALAQWINDGEPPFDLWEVDIRRAQPFQKNRRYLKARVTETLGLLYADHFPYRQMATARGVRRSPLHEHLKARGAVFGEVAGWERANWFARDGQEREYRYSWKRQNWFDNQRDEHLAVQERRRPVRHDLVRQDPGRGPRRAAPSCKGSAPTTSTCAPGKIVYTQMLNQRGGIESDLTVVAAFGDRLLARRARRDAAARPRLAAQASRRRIRRHHRRDGGRERALPDGAEVARNLIQKVSPNDFSNETNPFGTFQEIEIGMGLARAHRVTYVGELGWELYVSTDQAAHVFEAIDEAGADVGLKLCGLHTLDSCRIEKAFRHFGHDITDEDHVLEAGLGFAVKTGKGDFIGRDAVLKKRDAGLNRRLVQFRLKDPRAAALPQRGDRARRQDRRHRSPRAITAIISAARSGLAMCRARARARRTCWPRPTRSRSPASASRPRHR